MLPPNRPMSEPCTPATASTAIVLIGHGSRAAAGNNEIITFSQQFRRRWHKKNPQDFVSECFIEFGQPSSANALAQAAQQAQRVIAVPLILNAAGHVKGDIPHAITQAQTQFAATEFLCTPPLGVNEHTLAILQRELRQANRALDLPDPKTTGVILLGRGSSDREANGEIAKMARWLWEGAEHELVDIAFTGITYPRLESAVLRQTQLGMRQIIVLPYYLFTGVLIARIDRQMAHLQQQYPQIRFAHSSYFGFAEEIFQLVEKRIHEARQNLPCARADTRMDAAADHHHHGHPHGHFAHLAQHHYHE